MEIYDISEYFFSKLCPELRDIIAQITVIELQVQLKAAVSPRTDVEPALERSAVDRTATHLRRNDVHSRITRMP